MEIIICDDDTIILQSIKSYVQSFDDSAKIITFQSGEELLECDFCQADIVFLDYQMMQLDGIESARKLRERDYDGLIIFLTSYSEKVFEAFEVKPFDYLVKPVDESKIYNTMKRAYQDIEQTANNFFSYSNKNITYRIPLSKIYYFESTGRITKLQLKTESILLYLKIGDIVVSLKNKNFFRCHKGFIVNFEHIFQFSKNEIVMDNNSKIFLSKLKYKEFSEAFRGYMRRSR